MSNRKKIEDLNVNLKNRSEQLNPNNEKYWKARGYENRPENWKEKVLREQTNQLKSNQHRPSPKASNRVGINK